MVTKMPNNDEYDDEPKGWPIWFFPAIVILIVAFWGTIFYVLTHLTCHF